MIFNPPSNFATVGGAVDVYVGMGRVFPEEISARALILHFGHVHIRPLPELILRRNTDWKTLILTRKIG